ncbi:SDR family NAD(P)-dependent oxidoreductase [Mangrovicoccus sp. HB161399]|uniref:SDR family NAD(P)-dependent oxidoreductase n=1 Tax=Mangrovicoccus sp. HB161399 TaxID=2720392 RepID=UPI0015567FD4|nr:SDR family oxidoreductase [Mangrovicoccus sp. HB161399]
MDIRFDGLKVAVTGAGHGIGRRIAQDFARDGAEVLALDINEAGLAETAGPGIATAVLDVTDPDAVAAIFAEFPADVLVHSAGGVKGQAGRPVEEISLADWQAILDVNLTGAFLCAQAAIPAMKARGKGRIVTITSGAGLGPSLTGIQAYASAKHGEVGLTRQLAHELGPHGITVNSVAPGFVRSNPTTEKQWEAYGPEGQDRLVQGIARRRTGTPEDISAMVLFLASGQADWITGQIIRVDGGK